MDIESLVAQVHAEDFTAWANEVVSAHEIRRGVRVEVVKGMLRHGITGVVFWIGADRYAPAWQHRPFKVGFNPDDAPDTRLYTAITNVVAIDTDEPPLAEFTCTDDEAREHAFDWLNRFDDGPSEPGGTSVWTRDGPQ
jgi:hypothetical protein